MDQVTIRELKEYYPEVFQGRELDSFTLEELKMLSETSGFKLSKARQAFDNLRKAINDQFNRVFNPN